MAEAPAWRGHRRVLLRGGNVYSPADPFATAMLVAGHEIAWIGSEGAALALADGVDQVVDLSGALVAPGFVNAHATLRGRGVADERVSWARQGIALRHVVGEDPDAIRALLASAAADPGPLVVATWLAGGPARAEGLGVIGLGLIVTDQTPVGEVGAHVIGCTSAGLQASLQISGADALGVALLGLQHAATAVGPAVLAAAGHRIELRQRLSGDQIAAIAALGVSAVIGPAAGSGLAEVPIAAMAAAGIPLAFGADGVDPWTIVAAAVNHPDPQQRISARAAFAAHTRGGWRAARVNGTGAIVPGAPAHFVIWDVAELVVQAPDDRIQAWSTDPRSGTPGLPDMSPHAPLPRCRRTVVWGRPLN